MKKILFSLIFILMIMVLKAQKIDSIYFHLYTDSLKKGTYNYINVDGKLSNGSWKPLTSKEIEFTSSHCKFSGNELNIPSDFKEEKITVKAILKSNPSILIEKTIWIKKKPDPEVLPAKEEILRNDAKKNKRQN
ncbi:MAG TPA: hypothetical protein VI461_16775 [Chitinophagaceae bacterium]|nr:hypothetical protein [Chitinophagaceae bacterium]